MAIKFDKTSLALVKEIMETIPKTRDNDNELMFEIWKRQMEQTQIPLSNFLHIFADGDLMPYDTATRHRRKIQEFANNGRDGYGKHLLGTVYKHRKAKEPIVIEQLKQL